MICCCSPHVFQNSTCTSFCQQETFWHEVRIGMNITSFHLFNHQLQILTLLEHTLMHTTITPCIQPNVVPFVQNAATYVLYTDSHFCFPVIYFTFYHIFLISVASFWPIQNFKPSKSRARIWPPNIYIIHHWCSFYHYWDTPRNQNSSSRKRIQWHGKQKRVLSKTKDDVWSKTLARTVLESCAYLLNNIFIFIGTATSQQLSVECQE